MRTTALGILVSVALTACGGGGGDSARRSRTPSASCPPGRSSMPVPATPAVSPPVSPGSGVSVSAQRVFPNLTFTSPVLLIQAPGDTSKWYVVEQAGVVKSFDNSNGASTTSTFIDLQSRVSSGGEAGLLGMAFDPSYASNGRVYLSHTAPPTVSGRRARIADFTLHARRHDARCG